ERLLAVGGNAKTAVKISVKGKVNAKAKAKATAGDAAFAAGKFIDAGKAYTDAYAESRDSALEYAAGVAYLYAGNVKVGATNLKMYLQNTAGGKLEFQASAEAHLQAAGGAK